MKLIRFGEFENENPGVELTDGTRIDVRGFGEDYNEHFFKTDGLNRLKEWVEKHKQHAPVIGNDVRLGSPVARPSKMVCIGLNYLNHAKESGMEVPKEPVVFFKSTSSIVGPNDEVVIPKGSKKTDWEVELAVVIGKKASYVSKEEAMDYVAGYALHNDVSEREFQIERAGQWCKGKGCDTFAPLGPYMVTKDEIADPHNLKLWLKVNDTMHQDGNTNDFIFDVPTVISYLSQFMSLLPGDVISTGTPEGVGFGYDPQIYLKEGDVMELGIEGLGTSKQVVKKYQG